MTILYWELLGFIIDLMVKYSVIINNIIPIKANFMNFFNIIKINKNFINFHLSFIIILNLYLIDLMSFELIDIKIIIAFLIINFQYYNKKFLKFKNL